MARETDVARIQRAQALLTANRSQGIAALEELANNGSVLSMIYLAEAYFSGPNIDVVKAECWFRSAYKHGCSRAMYGLGMIKWRAGYLRQAEIYFSEGASQNDPLSMYWLAYLLISDSKYGERFLEAEEFLNKSAALGSLKAKIVLGKFYVRGKYDLRKIPRGLSLLSSGLIEAFRVALRDPSNWRL